MYRNRIYYRIKPLVPAVLRLAIRRWVARGKFPQVQKIWPIAPGSEQPPENWIGWPDGKQFALVLTHDVEGEEGLAKCQRLMEIEKQIGFCSSFHFIPEGKYQVSKTFRDELTRNGFEVGVHDLKHDGRLYRSREEFKHNARRINHYLKEWNAAGFRSGFMLHNLNWLHDLKIEYDASTFDTDPFEPQPDSRNTIFPFWVSNGNGGYAELPYTLPQDSTLFLLLQESEPNIWVKKLDWIAQHGGMALLNVHPDYLRFPDERPAARTVPISNYIQFLKHVRDRHLPAMWHPLPREMASFVAFAKPTLRRRKPSRVCMITHSFYETDNRVTRYAEALAQRGDEVDVVALKRSSDVPDAEVMAGVNVRRLQTRAGKNERTKLDYLWPLIRFLFVSSLWLMKRHRQKPYDLIHVHNIPDFMVFAAWYPKLTRTALILDIHDIVPEFFASKFGNQPSGFFFELLCRMERLSAAFADHVIIANHLWLDTYGKRTGTRDRCTPFINYVDSHVFRPAGRAKNGDKLIVIFPGGLQWHQGLDIAIRAFAKIRAELTNAEFHIYGDGNAKSSLVELAQELGLNGAVRFFEPTSVRKIAGIMAQADLGVVPKRADSFGNEAYSTKIMEFMAVGVPAVISSTKIDRYYFDESVVRFFPSGDIDELARNVLELLRDETQRRQLVSAGLKYAERNCWETRKQDYLALVDRLCPFC